MLNGEYQLNWMLLVALIKIGIPCSCRLPTNPPYHTSNCAQVNAILIDPFVFLILCDLSWPLHRNKNEKPSLDFLRYCWQKNIVDQKSIMMLHFRMLHFICILNYSFFLRINFFLLAGNWYSIYLLIVTVRRRVKVVNIKSIYV